MTDDEPAERIRTDGGTAEGKDGEVSETPLEDGETVDDDEEYTVREGDSLLIPAGVVHWYRNESDDPGAFICAVPNGDDEIDLVE